VGDKYKGIFFQCGSRLGLISDAVCACLHYVLILGLQTKTAVLTPAPYGVCPYYLSIRIANHEGEINVIT
jgi:hypothetical protein